MKKFFLLATLSFFSFLFIKANSFSNIAEPFAQTEVGKPIKISVCIGVGWFSVCTDVNIECHKVNGGFSCTITTARLVNGNYDPKNNIVSFEVPEDWKGIESLTIYEDAYLESEKGEKSTFYLKAGTYTLKENQVVISTSEK